MNPKRRTESDGPVRCSAWLGIVLLFCGLNNGLCEILTLGNPARHLVGGEALVGYNLHQLYALDEECFQGRNGEHLLIPIGGGLGQLRAVLEIGKPDLQAKLSEVPPVLHAKLAQMPLLLDAVAPGRNEQRSHDADNRAAQSEDASNDGSDNGLIHRLAYGFMVGFLPAMLGLVFGAWMAVRRTMPNEKGQR